MQCLTIGDGEMDMKTELKGIPEKVLMKTRNIGPVLQWQNGVKAKNSTNF